MLKAVMYACLSFGTNGYAIIQVMEATNMDRKQVRHRLGKLEASGLISRLTSHEVPGEKGWPREEIIYRNTSLLTERVTGLKTSSNRKANGWDKMWQATRALRRFTRNDLAAISGQTLANVTFFTKKYRKLGYLRCLGGSGQKNVVWMLVKDHGPHRPIEGVHNVD